MPSRRSTLVQLSILVALVACLVVPLAFYVGVFGFKLSADHTRWGEFGSAMAGIYSVFTALATLVLLSIQLYLLKRQVDLQRQINDHETSLAYVQQVRADMEFYIQQLREALDHRLQYGNTVREVLIDKFCPSEAEQLNDDRLRALATELDHAEPRSIAIWFAVYQGLTLLTSGKGPQFEVNKGAACLKLVATLGHRTCAALDHYHHVRTSSLLRGHYEFSPLLGEN
jgi:hypothetical protein